jgi:hypothetical protein
VSTYINMILCVLLNALQSRLICKSRASLPAKTSGMPANASVGAHMMHGSTVTIIVQSEHIDNVICSIASSDEVFGLIFVEYG